ncbi:unnamed protein product [Parnassius apollo]|uniref:(apollo) hypothetical protein n=1 Tax=Parnassius apollo TaxID=110799 RepID=A0A8S3X5L5_PARAO|nr:unnamed protein product [Parnassius apollo]
MIVVQQPHLPYTSITESDASTSTKQATATSETTGKRQRIFKESYIQFGFKCTVLNFEQRPYPTVIEDVTDSREADDGDHVTPAHVA